MDTKTAVILPCETCIIDTNSRVSIINVFETLLIEKFPFRYPFWVYAYIRGWEGQHKMRVSYKDPQNNTQDIGEIEFNFSSNRLTQTYVNRLDPEFNQYGEYIFYLYIDGECIAENFFSVIPPTEKE